MPKKQSPAVVTRAHEIKKLIEAQVMTKRVIVSDLRDPSRVQREITRLQERIARDQRDVEAMKYRLLHGKQLIADANSRITELRHELVIAENFSQITKLLDLQSKIIASISEPAEPAKANRRSS